MRTLLRPDEIGQGWIRPATGIRLSHPTDFLKENHMIGFIVAGLIIGLLARLILPGKQHIGLLWTLVLGILGSVVGGVVANLLRSGDIFELNVIGFVVAVIAAVALLAVAERAGLGAGPKRGRLEHR